MENKIPTGTSESEVQKTSHNDQCDEVFKHYESMLTAYWNRVGTDLKRDIAIEASRIGFRIVHLYRDMLELFEKVDKSKGANDGSK